MAQTDLLKSVFDTVLQIVVYKHGKKCKNLSKTLKSSIVNYLLPQHTLWCHFAQHQIQVGAVAFRRDSDYKIVRIWFIYLVI